MILIGVAGKAGAGKDTFAKLLYSWLKESDIDSEIVRFAGPLKAMMLELDPLLGSDHSGSYRFYTLSQIIHEYETLEEAKRQCASVRKWMQHFGTEVCRKYLGENVWIDAMTNHLLNNVDVPIGLIPDVRFTNEVEFIFDSHPSSQVFYIDRKDTDNPSDGHVSENNQLESSKYVSKIENDGNLVELSFKAAGVVSSLVRDLNI